MIKVWRPIHVAFAADILVENLRRLGRKVEIVDSVNPYDESLYIIYNAAKIKPNKLPANYIVYQTEVPGSKWFSTRYQETIRNALAVWDYSGANIRSYKDLNENIYVVTPGVKSQPSSGVNIPVLFYGYIKKSPERKAFLASLSGQVDIEIVQDKHSDDMWNLLKETEIVLNIHYYQNAPLETFRINEALSFGCRVISQRSEYIPECYTKLVEFADTPEEMLGMIRKPRGSTSPCDLSGLCNMGEIEQAMQLPLRLKPARKNILMRILGA